MCPKCFSLFDPNDCLYNDTFNSQGQHIVRCSKVCEYKRGSQGRYCHEPIGRETPKLISRDFSEYLPRLVYPVRSIRTAIEQILMRPGMKAKMKEWKTRDITCDGNIISDVYDGRVWKEFFNDINGKMSEINDDDLGVGLMINIDWFKPCKHSQYSVGAIYIVILNLPRRIRFLSENVITVALVPGGHEHKLCDNINKLLKPIVDELLALWAHKGLKVKTLESPDRKCTLRAALLLASCDQPAIRKLCGFIGHGSKQGCFKCHKEFKSQKTKPKGTDGKEGSVMIASGFEQCESRTREEHIEFQKEYNKLTRISEMDKFQSQTGYRCTELLRLPYFDTVRFSIIDTLHNVFLGTGKLLIRKLTKRQLFNKKVLDKMTNDMTAMEGPSNVSSFRHKIKHGFADMTGFEWKAFWCVYAKVLLVPLLVGDTFGRFRETVLLFIDLCNAISSDVVSLDKINIIKNLTYDFCISLNELFKGRCIFTNQHMHIHLHEQYLDFGPSHVWQLFALERMNGTLGQLPNNNGITREVTIMNAVCTRMSISTKSSNMGGFIDINDEECKLMEQMTLKKKDEVLSSIKYVDLKLYGPLISLWMGNISSYDEIDLAVQNVMANMRGCEDGPFFLLAPINTNVMDSKLRSFVINFLIDQNYRGVSKADLNKNVPWAMRTSDRLQWGDDVIGSYGKRLRRNCYITSWFLPHIGGKYALYAGRVQYFFEVDIDHPSIILKETFRFNSLTDKFMERKHKGESQTVTFRFAYVDWFEYRGEWNTVWERFDNVRFGYSDEIESHDSESWTSSILPVTRIASQFVRFEEIVHSCEASNRERKDDIPSRVANQCDSSANDVENRKSQRKQIQLDQNQRMMDRENFLDQHSDSKEIKIFRVVNLPKNFNLA